MSTFRSRNEARVALTREVAAWVKLGRLALLALARIENAVTTRS